LTKLILKLKALRIISAGQINGFESGFVRRTSLKKQGASRQQQYASEIHATPGK
jgi:hypothetical protein